MFKISKIVLIMFCVSLCYTNIYGQYTNCRFSNQKSAELCRMLTGEDVFIPDEAEKQRKKLDVSYDYANRIILSAFGEYLSRATLRRISAKAKASNAQKEIDANRNLLKGFLDKIIRHLKEHKRAYKLAEKKYGVNREIIAGILAKESALGSHPIKFSALTTLNTLYRNDLKDEKRRDWFYKLGKRNLGHLIKFCYDQKLTPIQCGQIKSSYAGAVGFPQFMPQNFHLAISYKKRKTPNLMDHRDSILSIANFLKSNAPVGTPYKLNDLDSISDIKKVENDYYRFFKSFDPKKEPEYSETTFAVVNNKYKCFACDREDLKPYRDMVLKIMTYNKSSNYALGVLRLAYEARQIRLKKKKIEGVLTD